MSITAEDYRFTPNDQLAELQGAAARFQHNLRVLQLLKASEAIAATPRQLSKEEQRLLACYSGWGDSETLKRLFPKGAYSWAPLCQELEGVLSQAERASLAASALNAHYTPLPIIRALYAALERNARFVHTSAASTLVQQKKPCWFV